MRRLNVIYALLYTLYIKPFGITHVTVASRSERKIQKERNDEGTAASGLLRVHAGILPLLTAYF